MQITLKVQNGRLLIFFPFSTEIVTKMQSLPFVRFEKAFKAWSIPLTAVSYRRLVETLGVKAPEVEAYLKENRKKIKAENLYRVGSSGKESLPHQIEGIKFLLNKFNIEVV